MTKIKLPDGTPVTPTEWTHQPLYIEVGPPDPLAEMVKEAERRIEQRRWRPRAPWAGKATPPVGKPWQRR